MIIIPARLHSNRLPNKLLLLLDRIPIIVRVANIAKEIDDYIVACDSNEILEVCKKHNINCILTSNTHQSGTDRCAEAATKLKLKDSEIVINLQGDEPFIESQIIKDLKNAMLERQDSTFMASCYKIIDEKNANDSNLVKVVLDKNSYALYFSRSKIPFNRENVEQKYYGHLGIYAFSRKSLLEFCSLPHSYLENIEKLEQLRAIWHKKNIFMLEVESKSIGIDTQEDYNKAQEILKNKC
ncbi:MAG: 3-deoxy-manno-octulosonate cytidylyltransferase [Helicobacteraceae bacterium]|nr:3-deoxy-manno-octulosonate cytidylyltransferase [Helicobacteraceae bacterium]